VKVFYSKIYPSFFIAPHQEIAQEILFLKCEFGANTGYASFIGWEDLGQPSPDLLLARRFDNPIFETLISRCWKDAFLFPIILSSENDLSFLNHSFISRDGFLKLSESVVKSKISGNLSEDLQIITELARNFTQIRLDANFKYSKNIFINFWNQISTQIQKKIEYIEDPFPWELDDYLELAKNIPLNIDHPFNCYEEITNVDQFYLCLRPGLRKINRRVESAITFTTNLSGALEQWQNACDLFLYGNLNDHHGLYSEINPWGENIFQVEGQKVRVKTELIPAIYQKLEEMNWTSLKI
jgi:hypothetical protein